MKPTIAFFCTACEGQTAKWVGQCPSCGEWNSLVRRDGGREAGGHRPSQAAATATGIAADDPALAEAAEASEGSVSRALTLLGGDALKLHQRTAALLATLPRVDPRELHALGDALGGSDRVALAAFIDSVDRWVGERLKADGANANANLPRLARLAEVWEKINSAARDTESYNLERKPLVFSVFGLLAEAMQ